MPAICTFCTKSAIAVVEAMMEQQKVQTTGWNVRQVQDAELQRSSLVLLKSNLESLLESEVLDEILYRITTETWAKLADRKLLPKQVALWKGTFRERDVHYTVCPNVSTVTPVEPMPAIKRPRIRLVVKQNPARVQGSEEIPPEQEPWKDRQFDAHMEAWIRISAANVVEDAKIESAETLAAQTLERIFVAAGSVPIDSYKMRTVVENKEDELRIRCEQCKCLFQSVVGFKKHLKEAHSEQSYFCHVCQCGFANANLLLGHMDQRRDKRRKLRKE